MPDDEDDAPIEPPAPPMPDDAALVSKALEQLKTQAGHSEDLAAARQSPSRYVGWRRWQS